jgi:acetyltransferase-like isoleucine patch superfamily enzyme
MENRCAPGRVTFSLSEREGLRIYMSKAPIRRYHNDFTDPLSWITRAVCRIHSLWLRSTYPFLSIGRDFWAHNSCEISRPITRNIKIGNDVRLDRDVWLNIPFDPGNQDAVIDIGDGSRIGRRCMISAMNSVRIEQNVILSPSILIMDHNHAFEDITVPIRDQGITHGGTIRIEEGCWIGLGVAIVCNQGELVIGKNSVIGANSVLTRSVPPYSVVAGNPAKVVKQFDASREEWSRKSSIAAAAPGTLR